MPRVKSPKAPTLTNARDALKVAMTAVTDGVSDLLAAIESKDYKQACAAFKQAHDYLLVGKDMLNYIYPHLAELKPKPEPKPAKAERPSDGVAKNDAARARREERNDKKRGPQRKVGDGLPDVSEASSDEPDDRDAP